MKKSLSVTDTRDSTSETRHRKDSLINIEMMMMIKIQKHLIDSYRLKLKETYNQLSSCNKNIDLIKKTNDFNPDDLINVFSDLSNCNFNLSSGLTLYNTLQNAQNLSSTGVGNEFYEIKQDLLNYVIHSIFRLSA